MNNSDMQTVVRVALYMNDLTGKVDDAVGDPIAVLIHDGFPGDDLFVSRSAAFRHLSPCDLQTHIMHELVAGIYEDPVVDGFLQRELQLGLAPSRVRLITTPTGNEVHLYVEVHPACSIYLDDIVWTHPLFNVLRFSTDKLDHMDVAHFCASNFICIEDEQYWEVLFDVAKQE